MKAYIVFDDFLPDSVRELQDAGISVMVHKKGQARPDRNEMKCILEQFDIVIIGTGQKIDEGMWENITTHRIIGSASAGLDHIRVPDNKKHLLTVVNTPTANVRSVAEYVLGVMLMLRKRVLEGNALYYMGADNKKLIRKPEDLYGTTVGLIGAGHISTMIMEMLKPFGTKILCYTKHPSQHLDLVQRFDVEFVTLPELVKRSDLISVNVTFDSSTTNLINDELVAAMKENCIFISISRPQVVDVEALLKKGELNSNFYICLDIDVIPEYAGRNNNRNIIFTPHIAGGTIETRKRMFMEVTKGILGICCMM